MLLGFLELSLLCKGERSRHRAWSRTVPGGGCCERTVRMREEGRGPELTSGGFTFPRISALISLLNWVSYMLGKHFAGKHFLFVFWVIVELTISCPGMTDVCPHLPAVVLTFFSFLVCFLPFDFLYYDYLQ